MARFCSTNDSNGISEDGFHYVKVDTTFLPQRNFRCSFIKEDKEYFDNAESDSIERTGVIFLTTFCDIQYLALRKKRVIDKVRNLCLSKKSSKSNNKQQQEYMAYLSKDVIYRYEPTEMHRDFIRHCEAWSVRGHYRNYKSGKTIFIKPYIKGKGKLNNKVCKQGERIT